MVCRDIKDSDLPVINHLNKQQNFALDSIENCIIDRIVISANEPAAYGIVKHYAEAIILVNKDKPRITRTRALKELMKVAIFGCQKLGLRQLHVFAMDEHVAVMLEKHYGFKRAIGIPMVKDI